MSSDLIFKRLFAVSLVFLALFVWGCEDDSSDSDSGPKTLIDLDSRRLEQTGEIQFYIDSFIKDKHIVLEDSELGTEELADFWADVAVRWGLRQKTAYSEATDEAEESSSEDSSAALGETLETFWLQRSDNYSDDSDTTEYEVIAEEDKKQVFVLSPQSLKNYLPAELADIPVKELEVVAEVSLAAQVAEGQFKSTPSIELPADFRITGEETLPLAGLKPSKPVENTQTAKKDIPKPNVTKYTTTQIRYTAKRYLDQLAVLPIRLPSWKLELKVTDLANHDAAKKAILDVIKASPDYTGMKLFNPVEAEKYIKVFAAINLEINEGDSTVTIKREAVKTAGGPDREITIKLAVGK